MGIKDKAYIHLTTGLSDEKFFPASLLSYEREEDLLETYRHQLTAGFILKMLV